MDEHNNTIHIALGGLGDEYIDKFTRSHFEEFLKNRKNKIGGGILAFSVPSNDEGCMMNLEVFGSKPDVVNLLVNTLFKYIEDFPLEKQMSYCLQIGGAFFGKALTMSKENDIPLPFSSTPDLDEEDG